MDRVLQSAELGQSAECESGLEIRWAYTLSQRQPARTVAHARNSGRAWGCRVRLEQLACRPLAPIWGWCSLRRRALTAVARVGVRSANDSDRTLGALIDDSTGIHLMAETEACQLKPSWPHTLCTSGRGSGVDLSELRSPLAQRTPSGWGGKAPRGGKFRWINWGKTAEGYPLDGRGRGVPIQAESANPSTHQGLI